MIKERLGLEEVRIKAQDLEVEGRDAMVIDDISSTGETMVEAIKILKKRGARKIYAQKPKSIRKN
jgi:ribose-phosphate pyrophosphokinase